MELGHFVYVDSLIMQCDPCGHELLLSDNCGVKPPTASNLLRRGVHFTINLGKFA